MLISSTYVCPVRGLADLLPPEPARLGQACKVAKSLGMDRLLLPVIEESMLRGVRASVSFLDGVIRGLDRMAEDRMEAWLIAPAQRVLGLDWAAPYLVRTARYPQGNKVFVDGRVRTLRPFEWWKDPSIIQKRIGVFREILSAVHGHPAITGWVILDGLLEWSRPDGHVAEMVLKSIMGEIRDRDEKASIFMSVGISALLDPEPVRILAGWVDGIRMVFVDNPLPELDRSADPGEELLRALYVGALGQWLLEKTVEVEAGWGLLGKGGNPQTYVEAGKFLAEQGLRGVTWLNLADPNPGLCDQPPWLLRPGLERAGLLDRALEPKNWVEAWFKEIHSAKMRATPYGFVDLSREEYLEDPPMHLKRLWEHYRESVGY
jgi:hypothetical protein